MTRNVFLKNESYNDFQEAMSKADTEFEYRHMISERLKGNGWSKEKELDFREHCQVIGFVLPFQREKKNPLESNTTGRTQARLLADKIKAERHHSGVLKTDTVEE